MYIIEYNTHKKFIIKNKVDPIPEQDLVYGNVYFGLQINEHTYYYFIYLGSSEGSEKSQWSPGWLSVSPKNIPEIHSINTGNVLPYLCVGSYSDIFIEPILTKSLKILNE